MNVCIIVPHHHQFYLGNQVHVTALLVCCLFNVVVCLIKPYGILIFYHVCF